MDFATVIGFGMLVIFLIGFIITIWNDTHQENKFWEQHEKNKMKE